MTAQQFSHRGTTINKIENEFDFGLFEDDFVYCSNGFRCAVERGMNPTSEITDEWHHYFLQDKDYGWKAYRMYFN